MKALVSILFLIFMSSLNSTAIAQSTTDIGVISFDKLESLDVFRARLVPLKGNGLSLSGITPGSFWQRIGAEDGDIWTNFDSKSLADEDMRSMLYTVGQLALDTEKIHQLRFLRNSEEITVRFVVKAPRKIVTVFDLLHPNSKNQLFIAADYCDKFGFNEWTIPPLDPEAEHGCDEQRIANFSKLLSHCESDDSEKNAYPPRVKFFDLDFDKCLSCNDLALWKAHLRKLYEEKNRNSDGSQLTITSCGTTNGASGGRGRK